MTLTSTIHTTLLLLCFNLLLHSAELFSLAPQILSIWSYKNLRTDLEQGLPLPKIILAALFSNFGFRMILGLQVVLATTGFLFSTLNLLPLIPLPVTMPALIPVILFGLGMTHLLTCIRFRGTWNGGSDMMTFVVLTGLCITQVPHPNAPKFGMLYIAIHGIYSYFKAGRSKVTSPEWLSGQAISGFLKQSIFVEARKFGDRLEEHRMLTQLLCWGVLSFELGIIALPFFPRMLLAYFFCACFFHLMIALCFGLNRFFWVWLSAWPAIAYFVRS